MMSKPGVLIREMGQGGREGEGEEEEGGTTGGVGAMEVEVEVGIKICGVVNRRLWQLQAEWEGGEGGERDVESEGSTIAG